MEYATILEKLQLNYTVLKGKFLRTSKPYIENRPDALDDLKSYYSSVINSARTSDYINNLESLLGILEKRNELSYENIKPLIHIEARYVRSPELGTLLRNYEENMHDYPVVPLFNVYDLYSEQSYESQQGYTSGVQSNAQSAGGSSLQDPMTIYSTTLSSFHLTIPAPVQITSLPNSNNEDSRIATIVFLEVSDKLGRHWRDVARFLGVTEHDIDDIDYQPQLPLKEKALKAFTKFQSKSDPLEWKPRLQRALEKARRRDLMEMVEKLLSQQHRSA
ncbi:uncharacterized protein Fadd [Venturia canescens]|uniref:uncharacterized protein Fadd n=1 Tax=Venturia canescens TaxID=32260 RepID=UPI001C9D5264|nr:uncharacterized protein LOC122410119 [Venturia canescens]